MAGLGTLIRLILRRDRFKLPIWMLAVVVSLIAMVPLLKETYGEQQALTTLYQTFGVNPAGLFLTGPMDAPSFGALMTIETLLWWGFVVAFMNTLFVVRHTRQNEEMGAQELILSGKVHRRSGVVAALLVAFIVNGVVAAGIGLGMQFVDGAWSAESAWLYGAAFGVFGLAWAVIAAMVAQLVVSARSANGILAGMIGAAFVVRGIADFVGTKDLAGIYQPLWISWLSPFGWLQATRPLTLPEWWPLAVPIGFAALGIPVALILLDRRDVGAGILPARKGHAKASRWLGSPLGVTWYLQRNIFIGWAIGVVLMVAMIGLLVPEMSRVYESSENVKAMIMTMGGHGAMIPSFLSAMLSIIVLMVVAYVVQGLGRLRSEESSGHLENLLATRFSRLRWLWLHSATVLVGGAVILVLTGFLLAVFVNMGSDLKVDIGSYVQAAVSYWPVLALFAGMYVVLFGLFPGVAGPIVWLYYGVVVFMSWLAPLLKLDEWMMNLSPLTYVASAPVEAIDSVPLMIMCGIAATCFAVGTLWWRYRDLRGH